MEADKIIKLLSRNSRILNNLDEHEMLEILKFCVTKTCKDQDVIFKEGSGGKELYIIVSGSVIVKKKGKVIDIVRSGECFGEMAAWGDELRSATTVSEGDVLLLEMSSFKLDSLSCDLQIKLLKNILTVISSRLTKRIEEISH